jgi:peptidoglycan/xylan/chitin deacetylase (PgdA/CDA1 family)
MIHDEWKGVARFSQPMAATAVAYHEILPEPSLYSYECSASTFRDHLQLLSCLRDSGRDVNVTFDDGYRSNAEIALPILEEFGIKATFFVLAGPMGRSGSGLSWRHLRTFAEAGHRIESHGWQHRLLTSCSESELQEELHVSRQELESRLSRPVLAISAPGGRWNRRVALATAAAGYRELYHSDPWAPPIHIDGLSVSGRIMVTQRMSSDTLGRLLTLSSTQRHARRLHGFMKHQIRQMLGERRYHQLWCRLFHYESQSFDIHLPTTRDQART